MRDRTDVLRGARGWQGVLAAGLAVLTAASVTAYVGVGDPTSADTYVTSVTRAVIALSDGTERGARIGDLLPRGARLRTGEGGGARLTTAGRDVYVGALSTVRVLDGVHESLELGQVMVDSRSGPELALDTRAGTVTTEAGGLARIERGLVLRVGVFDGSATVAVEGRQLRTTVPALYQVTTQYGAVPGRTTALALTGDDWEQRLAAHLTRPDGQLRRLQEGLHGAEGALVLAAAPVVLRTASVDCDGGEQALSVALAEVATSPRSAQQNLDTVCRSRREGGSWGVVAAIVRASVTDVSGRLDQALGTDPNDEALLAGSDPRLPGVGQPSPTRTVGGSPGPSGSPRPTPTPTPTVPPTTPPPSPSVVDEVVDTITSLLPTPSLPPIVVGPVTIQIG